MHFINNLTAACCSGKLCWLILPRQSDIFDISFCCLQRGCCWTVLSFKLQRELNAMHMWFWVSSCKAATITFCFAVHKNCFVLRDPYDCLHAAKFQHLSHALQVTESTIPPKEISRAAKASSVASKAAPQSQSNKRDDKVRGTTVRSTPSTQAAKQPPRQRASRENQSGNSSATGYVPAYMKATASVKAKDARDQQAKIAANRSALTEKKWNRA